MLSCCQCIHECGCSGVLAPGNLFEQRNRKDQSEKDRRREADARRATRPASANQKKAESIHYQEPNLTSIPLR